MVVYDVEAFLQKVSLMIESALNKPEIQKKLESCNYDFDQLVTGRNLLEELSKLHKHYQREYGRKSEFLEMIKKDQKFAFDTYVHHQRLIHQALKDTPGLEEALNLNEVVALDNEGWLDQASIFYKKVNFIAKDLSSYGLDNSELAQSRAMIDALKDAKIMQRKIQKKAKEAIVQRDQVLNILQQWVYKFNTIAQIALHDDVLSLESLGIELES
ncbi:hypothetical protein [Catalinimonas locisalis]|uniref:hypothetical protein n=1 Tax=Catalinimonas locisalis TaxID=3133978 RepID=UPI0031019E09